MLLTKFIAGMGPIDMQKFLLKEVLMDNPDKNNLIPHIMHIIA
jgi:hypothetical protein